MHYRCRIDVSISPFSLTLKCKLIWRGQPFGNREAWVKPTCSFYEWKTEAQCREKTSLNWPVKPGCTPAPVVPSPSLSNPLQFPPGSPELAPPPGCQPWHKPSLPGFRVRPHLPLPWGTHHPASSALFPCPL